MGGVGLQVVSSPFKFSSGHISTLADEVPPDLKHQRTLLPRAKPGDAEEGIQTASAPQRHTQPPPSAASRSWRSAAVGTSDPPPDTSGHQEPDTTSPHFPHPLTPSHHVRRLSAVLHSSLSTRTHPWHLHHCALLGRSHCITRPCCPLPWGLIYTLITGTCARGKAQQRRFGAMSWNKPPTDKGGQGGCLHNRAVSAVLCAHTHPARPAPGLLGSLESREGRGIPNGLSDLSAWPSA